MKWLEELRESDNALWQWYTLQQSMWKDTSNLPRKAKKLKRRLLADKFLTTIEEWLHLIKQTILNNNVKIIT